MDAGRDQGFFVSGGTLPPDSASYLERGADKTLFESLLAGRFCYVLNSRQLGKSSLSVHTIGRLESVGVRTAFLDMTRFGGKNLTAEQWYTGLAVELGRELGCRKEVVAYWKEHAAITPVQRLFGAIRDVVLRTSENRPLVIFIDEIDATRSLPFDPDEFYAAIRECFNRRVSEPSFERLTFCLLGVAVPSDLIRNRATTPFNIGERIALEDFRLDELAAFAPVLGPNGRRLIERVHYWTGGHPFLSQSLCRSIANLGGVEGSGAVDDIVQRELFDYKARVSNINLADVGNIALYSSLGGGEDADATAFRANLLSTYERTLLGKEVLDDESNRVVVLLKLSGIVRSDGRRLIVRNRIYEHVFDRVWIEEHMPEQELRRQRQSYRRGAWRTTLAASGMVAALGLVAAFAWYSRVKALSAESKLGYELYVADMNSLRLFYDNGDTGRIEAVLARHESSPYRGFEWGYWLGRFHDAKEEYTLDYKAPGKREDGHISADGREVCIADYLTSTATIVDRATRQPIKTVKVASLRRVLPLARHWVSVELIENGARVTDLKSSQVLSRLGDAGHLVYFAMTVEHSDYILTGEGWPGQERAGSGAIQFLNLWNAATGRKLFGCPDRASGAGFVSFSTDGRYVLTSVGLSPSSSPGPPSASRGEAVIRDLRAKTDVDRFSISRATRLISSNLDRPWLFYTDGPKVFLRDVHAHRSTEWRLPIDGDWVVKDSFSERNQFVSLLNRGRCIVTGATANSRVSMWENVFAIQPGSRDGEYLGASSTVRLYDVDSPANAEIVARGTRITRYGPGTLNVFVSGISRITEQGFRPSGALAGDGPGEAYMYSGRWRLGRGSSGRYDQLLNTDGRYKPIQLPFQPAQWSCGLDPDSVAFWHPRNSTLVAYSGTDCKIRWSWPHVDDVNALWVSPDGTRAFLVRRDRYVEVFDMTNGRALGPMNSHNMGPLYMTFSADGSRVFTCGGDGRAVMWDVRTLAKIREFRGNEQQGMTSADLSPDGRRVVTTSVSGAWQLWDASNGIQLLDVQVSPQPLSSAIFCSDGRRIVTAGGDGNVRVWTTVEKDPTTYVHVEPALLNDLYR